MEKISIIVPVYNVEKYLRNCLDSIINQTYTNLEIILVDDGSPDGSGKICDEYALKDGRIKIFHNKNMGLSGARNFGIDNATGEYITFVDSDDEINLYYIEKLFKILKENNADLSICGFKYIQENKKTRKQENKKIRKAELYNAEEAISQMYSYIGFGIKCTSFITSWGNLIPREYYKDIKFPLGKINEDEFTTYKLYLKADKIAYIKEPLYYYYKRSGSIMNSGFNLKRLEVLDAFEERIKILKEKNYDISLTVIRYYLRLCWIKNNILKNKIDYDISIIDKKMNELNNMKLNKGNFKYILNSFIEKYVIKLLLLLYRYK